MWFSSNHPDRPRRRVSHATVVAYVALLVAALGIPAAAVATTVLVPRNSVGTAQLRNGAVTNPKIRNGAVGNHKLRNRAVGNHKLRNRAVTGAKVANNTLGGRTINESTLRVTRIARRIRGSRTVTTFPNQVVPYPLTNNNYTQPARTTDAYLSSLQVRFPVGCRRPANGYRYAVVELRVNGFSAGAGTVENFGTGRVTTQEGFTAMNLGGFATSARQRRVTAFVFGHCGSGSTARPQVLSVHVNVARFFH